MHTKAYLLRSGIAFALRSVKLEIGRRYLKPGFTEEQRYEIADRVIVELRKHGRWKDLDDVVEAPVKPSWIDGKPPE